MCRKYLFFDIDGVLNHRGARVKMTQRKHMLLLKGIVESTGAELVMISDWRLSFLPGDHMPEMAELIKKQFETYGMSFRLVSLVHAYKNRAREINEWNKEHPHDAFAIIDDADHYSGTNLEPNWVRIDYRHGLTEKEMIRTIGILNEIQPA